MATSAPIHTFLEIKDSPPAEVKEMVEWWVPDAPRKRTLLRQENATEKEKVLDTLLLSHLQSMMMLSKPAEEPRLRAERSPNPSAASFEAAARMGIHAPSSTPHLAGSLRRALARLAKTTRSFTLQRRNSQHPRRLRLKPNGKQESAD